MNIAMKCTDYHEHLLNSQEMKNALTLIYLPMIAEHLLDTVRIRHKTRI